MVAVADIAVARNLAGLNRMVADSVVAAAGHSIPDYYPRTVVAGVAAGHRGAARRSLAEVGIGPG